MKIHEAFKQMDEEDKREVAEGYRGIKIKIERSGEFRSKKEYIVDGKEIKTWQKFDSLSQAKTFIDSRLEIKKTHDEEYENFKPHFWIDTGQNNIMYTLKNSYIDWRFSDGVQVPYVRHGFIKSLSIDYEEAVAKAKEYVGEGTLVLNGESQTNDWGTGNSNKGDRYVTELTEEQKEQQEKIRLAEEAAAKKEKEEYEKAEPVPAEGDRIKIEGLVLSCYERETQWGRTVKNIIQDDRGFKVCGSAVADKDERVSFMAQVNASEDDPKFGFYKRPTKVLLENENPEDYKMVCVDIQGWKEKEYAINLKWLYNAIENEESLSKDKFAIQGAKTYSIEFNDLDRVKELIESKLSVEYLKGE